MKAVVDEGVPRRLPALLRGAGLDVSPFPNVWKGMSNGSLLAAMEQAGFDCLLTCDRNLTSQQRLAGRKLSLLVLPAQRFEDLVPFVSAIEMELRRLEVGKIIVMTRSIRDD